MLPCHSLAKSLAILVCFPVILLKPSASTHADHPSYPITVELGPDNKDFQDQLAHEKAGSSEITITKLLSRLNGYDLSNRDLRMAQLHLYGFELTDVSFDGSDLTGANLLETGFNNCSFRNATMRRVYLAGSRERYIRPNCDLTGADIAGSTISVSSEQLEATKNYQRKDLSHTTLIGRFEGVSFAGFNLRNATLHSDLAGCDLTDAEILNSTLQVSKRQLASTRSYQRGDLDSVTFKDCDFSSFNFSRVNLGRFVGCDMQGADLTDACFAPAKSAAADWGMPRYGFTECNLLPEQFYSTRNYKLGRLPKGFKFVGMDLSGWDFSDMDLRYTTFHLCNVSDANFENARGGIFRTARGMTAKQIKSTWNYKHRRMSESGFVLPKDLQSEFEPQSPFKREE